VWAQPVGPRVGSGGFASVWAIPGGVLKVAHADHDLARARLAREAEALGAIGAPAVPRLDGHGVLADGRAWIAMEKIEGDNLADLTTAGPMRIERAVGIAAALLASLVRVHAARFVHRDIKPDNLVLRADGSVVILDLGLARKIPSDPDDPTRAGVQVGSLEYMPPEQLLDAGSVDVHADLYAFGCILYELCAGRPPFIGDAAALERAHAALRPPPLGALVNVPPELETLVHECLAKLPARRPGSATELRSRLLSLRDTAPSLARAQHSMSVISEGKQPVVLLWAELPRVDRALLAMLAARKIAVVSQRGRKVLGGVVGAEHADPAGAAIAAARELAAAGARVALHLDLLTVAPRSGGIALGGPAAERPEDWIPAVPWTGVVVTRALATVTQAPTRASDLGPGFLLLGEAGETTELFGRDALIADLSVDAATALAGNGPALALLIADHGVGKTSLANALVPRLRELGARVVMAAVPPPGSGRPGHSALAELIGTPEGPVVRAVGDALRAAARAQPTAILLDDLHLAEHDLLDALEYATLGGEPLALWVLGIGSPRLEQRRPGFGQRAERHRRDELPPLDEDAAVAMTAALLRPAEYPPLRALRQIASISRGNPMHLRALAREIHDRGAIRTRPNGEHFLDTTALDALPPIALGPWLAARELSTLSLELVALARVCAVLGDDIEREEIGAVFEAVERRGGATTTIDVDVGLRELSSAGILVTTARGWTFRQALLQEGVYSTTNEDERRALHQGALEYWQGKPAGELAVAERVARHAEAVGERQAAAVAFATIGDRAHEEHRVLDADQAWQGAVRNLPRRDAERSRALLGRARSRYRLQRLREALADLEEAVAIAAEIGDVTLEIEILVEQATALDWGEEFARSKEVAVVARQRFDAAPNTARSLAVELDLADARALFREQRFAEAVPRLRGVMAAARATETQTIAGTLLAPILVELGALDDAQALFERLIAMCEQVDDRFHLAVAYVNRAWLWLARGEIERTVDDLRIVIQLAREGGQVNVERAATYNLGESRLWQGSLDEALRLARRSLALQRIHGEASTRLDRLLIARIHAARGDQLELRSILGSLRSDDLTGEELPTMEVLEAVARNEEGVDWERLLAGSDSLPVQSRLELAHLVALQGGLVGARREAIREIARRDPMWSRRIREF
jgi:tetratricopeptide (TPR) repeat protein